MRASTGTSVCCLVSTLARTMALSPSSFSSVNRSRSPPKRSIFEMYVCSNSSAKRCTNSSRCGGVRCCQCGPSARRAVSCTSKTSVAIFRTAARRSGFLSSALSEGSSRTLRTASVYSRTWSVGAPARTGAAAHATRLRAMAATTDDRIIRRLLPAQYTVRGGPGGPRLTDDRLQVGEDFALELVEALAEDVAEVAVPVLAALERLEVVDHARKAVAPDQVIRHQERQLIGRQRAVVVEQELAALADADRELRKLGGARRRDLRVVHETVLERLAPAIHVEREGRGHRQPQLADQDRRQPAHGGFVVAERARVARDRDGGGIDGEWNHNAAGATGCDDDQRQQRGDAKAAVGNPFHTPRHFHTPARSKGRTFPSSGCETYNATPSHGCAAGGGGRAQTRTCSGRTPRPMSRPGRRRSRGKRASSRTAGGGRRGRRRRSTRRTIRFWTSTWTRWVTRVGHSRRRCTRARSSALTRPSRSGAASRLAAATASWIARLMPTPPTGDIACGASPRQSTPGPNQRARRSTRTVSSFTSSQSRSALASARASASRATSSRNAARPRARISSSVPLAITKPHCQ